MTARATYDFTGATALVTGGTSGIGHAIVSKLRDAGAAVTTTGRKPQAADYAVDLEGIEYRQLELTDRTGIRDLAGEFNTLDILVNNAGAIFAGGLDESTPDGFRATVDLNLFGPYELSIALHDALARSTAKGGASVVGLSSLSTVRAVPMVPAYGAAKKSGVLSMTRNFAMKWGSGPNPGQCRDRGLHRHPPDDVTGARPRLHRRAVRANPAGTARDTRRGRRGRDLPLHREQRLHHRIRRHRRRRLLRRLIQPTTRGDAMTAESVLSHPDTHELGTDPIPTGPLLPTRVLRGRT